MQIRFLVLASVTVSVGSAWAQLPPVRYYPLSQVQQFLGLSDSQLQTILANNDFYNQFSSEKQSRNQQVQTEIADETGKSPLDPHALGIRYAEIETICREMKDKAASSQQQNISVLNDAQKSKLNVLSDALKLVPIISEAQNGNLMVSSTSAPYGFTSSSQGYAAFLLGGVIGPVNGCSLPFPVAPFRSGDFAGTLKPQINRVSGANTYHESTPTRWFDTTKFVKPEPVIQK